jgi:hypothetical protein
MAMAEIRVDFGMFAACAAGTADGRFLRTAAARQKSMTDRRAPVGDAVYRNFER